MEFRYLGFDQRDNTRTYRFDAVEKGQSAVRLAVTADMALFLKHHVSIQEGPFLCARKLTADSAVPDLHNHELTNEDLIEFATERTDAETRRAARRLHRSGRFV